MTEQTAISKDETFQAKSAKKMAWLLDECIRIPGTNIKFGLDPIIGLIPGGGELIGTLAGATVLGEAGKKGIPFRILFKMGGNMLLNALMGTIPVFGDLFSVWFKSNKRNYEMLNQYLSSEDGKVPKGGWGPMIVVGIIIGSIILINLAILIGIGLAAAWAFHKFQHLTPVP
jgi:Domain of unknown function (DUF4112)